jgi:hypothetical protein
MKLLLLIVFPLLTFAQVTPARSKGEVFKHRPEKPYEDIKKSGLIVVNKTTYGLTFKDNTINDKYKNLVKSFFKQGFSGYSALKPYSLKIEQRQGKYYIENHLIE